MKFKLAAIVAVAVMPFFSSLASAEVDRPECIAPAKPGGGFDLTCKLAQSALQETGALKAPMRVTYMPGGIGAVAYNTIVAQRPADGNAIVAFSGGSLLNLAIGKFGKYTENDVRWLAAIGADYGMVAVRSDAPWKTLKDLMQALAKDPTKVVFGAGGSVGSQDWAKAALVARAAGVDPKTFRFVAFEGGGEAFTALLGGHVQVVSGDASEAASQIEGGKIRVLAVLADQRVPGALHNIPTAKEEGYDVEWPIIRGFYMGPKVADADYKFWLDAFNKTLGTKEFAKLREERGLFPFSKTGADLDAYIKQRMGQYRKIAADLGLK